MGRRPWGIYSVKSRQRYKNSTQEGTPCSRLFPSSHTNSLSRQENPGFIGQSSRTPSGGVGGVGGDVYPYRPGEEPYTIPGGNQPPAIQASYDPDTHQIRMPGESHGSYSVYNAAPAAPVKNGAYHFWGI